VLGSQLNSRTTRRRRAGPRTDQISQSMTAVIRPRRQQVAKRKSRARRRGGRVGGCMNRQRGGDLAHPGTRADRRSQGAAPPRTSSRDPAHRLDYRPRAPAQCGFRLAQSSWAVLESASHTLQIAVTVSEQWARARPPFPPGKSRTTAGTSGGSPVAEKKMKLRDGDRSQQVIG